MTSAYRRVYILAMDMTDLELTDEMAPATPEMISPCRNYIFGNADTGGMQMIAHTQECKTCRERTGN